MKLPDSLIAYLKSKTCLGTVDVVPSNTSNIILPSLLGRRQVVAPTIYGGRIPSLPPRMDDKHGATVLSCCSQLLPRYNALR
jgi:hypothetical protein